MIGIILIIILTFFFPGIINRTKSILSGRKGPVILQPMYDIRLLLNKKSIFSNTSSIITQVGPTIYFASIVTSLLFLPFGSYSSVINFDNDFIYFIYILAFGKFFMVLTALDAGSSFQGMGASREVMYSMLIEPAILILIGALSMITGYTSFDEIFKFMDFTNNSYYLVTIICCYILVKFAMVENSRLPIDDPKTHLELTMVHEVMILDISGFDLALIHFANALKFTIFGSLIANCLFPPNSNILVLTLIFIVTQISFAVIIGFLESFNPRNKVVKNPQYLLTISAISLLAFVIALILTNKIT
ncbi:MAG: hypothetical protein A2X12_12080 [Bacteroidetes bacterium GWE2_29_8]|nr:MAG: hypothetical protein A2X12_12080 [Bacteroidetes bacterium GWE2_29_8]OFY24513.1 MAG: hypothetical protein A2X02_01855 [Bacteroidetes bacterium GWF2_29_10]